MRFQIRERELLIRKGEYFNHARFIENYVKIHGELIVHENTTNCCIIGEPASLWRLIYEITCDNILIID